VHKLGIVLKELNEAEVWIDILVRRRMTEGKDITRIQEDCKTLCRIIAASVRMAGRDLSRLNKT
jgi:four helix bundle protein